MIDTLAAVLKVDPDWSLLSDETPPTIRASLVRCLAKEPAERFDRISDFRRRAVDLEPDSAAAHCTLGRIYYLRREHDRALAELAIALELNPSYAWAHYGVGAALVFSATCRRGSATSAEVTSLRPDFSVAFVRSTHLYSDPVYMSHYVDGLMKAGLAE